MDRPWHLEILWFVVAITAKQDLPSGFKPECYSLANGWIRMIIDMGEKTHVLYLCECEMGKNKQRKLNLEAKEVALMSQNVH